MHAQQEEKPKFLIKIDRVRVGYRSHTAKATFKAGFWIPVYVDIDRGLERHADDQEPTHFLEIESNDSEGLPALLSYSVPAVVSNPTKFAPSSATPNRAMSMPAKMSRSHSTWDHREYKAPRPGRRPLLELSAHLYLTLGSNIADLREALALLAQNQNRNACRPRYQFQGYRAQVCSPTRTTSALLPEHWFGYQTADLMILTTDRKDFLTGLFARRQSAAARGHRPVGAARRPAR